MWIIRRSRAIDLNRSATVTPMPLPRFTTVLRVLYGTLFICGCYFALFAWIGAVFPFCLLVDRNGWGLWDALFSITACFAATTGYFVWLNWLSYAWRGKFLFVSAMTMQVLSFFGHLAWLVAFHFARAANPVTRAGSGVRSAFFDPLNPLDAWFAVNIAVPCVVAYFASGLDVVSAEPTDAMDSR